VVTLHAPWLLTTVTKYGLLYKAICFVFTNLTATYRYGGNVIRAVVVNHGDNLTNQSNLTINIYTFFFIFYYNQQMHSYKSIYHNSLFV